MFDAWVSAKTSNTAVDEFAWCSMLFARLATSSWIRTRLFVNQTTLKTALAVICDHSMNTFGQCIVTAVATINLIAGIFEGSSEVQWAQHLVRSGAHRAAQAHVTV
jgi:hypothetical protein